jgi:hypothetical protein
MSTKKELEDQIKTLKDKIKSLHSDLKESFASASSEVGEHPLTALGLVKIEGVYKIVRVLYNPLTKTTKLDSIFDADKNTKSAELATFRFDEKVQEEIFSKMNNEITLTK